MFTKNLSKLYVLLLILIVTKCKNLLDDPFSFINRRDFSQKLTSYQCTYGGGIINNSTLIELGNCYGLVYYIGLTLGTGTPQTFIFQFDTGSPTLWVPTGNPPTGYNSSLSNTYSTTNQYNTLTYGDGSFANGYMGYDIVTVQGTPINGNNSIEWASNVSSGIFGGIPDVEGLVGMDYGSTPNFLDVAYLKGQISTPVFALQLNYQNQTSYLHYNNGLSQSIIKNMIWVPQQQNVNGYWQTALTSVTLGGINFTYVSASYAVIDSGTSAIIFNTNLFNAIVQQFFSTPDCFNDPNNNNFLTCYCTHTWPTFVFNFSNTVSVNMSSALYLYPSPYGSGYCFMGIQTQNDSQIILGDVFFRGYIIQFDRLNNVMGFYHKGSSNNGASGNGEIFNNFDPQYFVVAQYVLCAVGVLMAILGIGLYVKTMKILQGKSWEGNLGMELM